MRTRLLRPSLSRWLLPAVAVWALSCHRSTAPVTLTVVQRSDILTLDPNEQFEVVTDTVAMNLFDSLLRFDGHMTLQPSLAQRWETPNGRTWRIHLRQGVHFHDGTLLSADDVVYTFRRVLSHPDSELYAFLSGIDDVRALDLRTVEIVTRRPTNLLTRLSFIYILPGKLLAREGEKEFFLHPVGSGAYRFVSRRPGERVELEAFSDYWGGKPKISRAVFLTVPHAEDQWRAVTTSHPTVLLSAPRVGWSEHMRDMALRLVERASLSVSFLGVNVSPRPGNPLADRRVRQAIRKTLDLKELVRRGGDTHAFPASQFVPPEVIGYNPELSVSEPDPDGARHLLAEAGFPSGLDLVLDSETGGRTLVVEEIIRQLGAIGIRVTSRFWPREVLFSRIDAGLSDFHLTGWICSSGESSELFESSFHTREPHGTLGRSNGIGYSNLTVDRLTEQIIATIDTTARIALEKRAMAIAVEDLPWIPLYVEEDRYALTADLDWEPRADGEILLSEIRLR
jgi:peptide/nickel transport system substrate-binding protein